MRTSYDFSQDLGACVITLPGSASYGVPNEPLVQLRRDIEDLQRTVRQMQSLLVNAGTIQVNDPTSGTPVFFVGQIPMNDGSGRMQAAVEIFRPQDGSTALIMYDGGVAFGHTLQQALQWYDRLGGNVVIADDTTSGQGLAKPYIPIGFFTDNTVPTSTTTSASFVTLQTLIGFKQHPKVSGQILVYADSGTTGTIQLIDQDGNLLFTTNLSSAQFSYVSFGPVALAGGHELPVSLNIQGKVLTGAGKVGARGVAAWGVQS